MLKATNKTNQHPGDRELLSDVLRASPRRTGINSGCSIGICGTCTVLAPDGPIRSCLVLARDVDAEQIRTLEDVRETDAGRLIADSFAKCHALQCGYCTPGFMMLAADMLESAEAQSRSSLAELVSGNLCRCTGYEPILEAFTIIATSAGLITVGDGGAQ
ncbi:(2Fe-2S)-binding protein [Paenarthrobacter sp. NPDC089675]|uniref:(2Fe-2S)-binding protein n=1 Tax=Paenarthrobacter sp. NPDC089675 TaxID=3364376 RepID=UPI003808738F